MSDILQFRDYPGGHHPDADQLNAFVEHTLPEHERLDTLAHLAECADCREIASLSLPPLEDAVAEEPEPAVLPRFTHWLSGVFSNWIVIGIGAPALAALVILAVHIRNLPTDQHHDKQVADARPAVRPEPSMAANSAPAGAPTAQKATKIPSEPIARPKQMVDANRPGNLARNGLDTAVPALSPQRLRSTRMIEVHAPPAPAPPSAGQSVGGPVLLRGNMAGVASQTSIPPPTFNRSSGRALLQAPLRTAVSSPIATPAPAPAKAATQSAMAQRVSPPVANPVTDAVVLTVNGPPSQPDNRNTSRAVPDIAPGLPTRRFRYVSLQAPLPSGQPVLSEAANLNRRLALDTHNQLFFSEDDGQHWTAVAASWRGHAITVAALLSSPERTSALALAIPERFTRNAMAIPQAEAAEQSSLGGAVTDASGAVIPNATVVASDSHTAFVRSVKTDTTGRYLVEELPPGVYHLDVQASGFLKQTRTAVVAASQQAVTNLVLPVGASAETVSVQAASEQLQVISRATPASAAKAKKPATPLPPVIKVPPLFVVATDAGERWTSSDGQTWQHE